MVWKQDLAKLKSQLKEEPAPPPKKVAPVASPVPPRSMEDEDALFLAMMGRQAPRSTPASPAAKPAALQAPAPEPKEAPKDFSEALAGLKGMRPLGGDPVLRAASQETPPPAPTPVIASPAAKPEPSPAPVEPKPVLAPAPQVQGPLRIQLAAGMAVEVDGTLDLRGHSLRDALERLKDRVADAQYLRWRSLLVQLGSEAASHEGFLELLAQGALPSVTRYAQAPVPMGGPQAWILYFHA